MCRYWIGSSHPCVDRQLEDVRSFVFGPQTVGYPRSEEVYSSSVAENVRKEQTRKSQKSVIRENKTRKLRKLAICNSVTRRNFKHIGTSLVPNPNEIHRVACIRPLVRCGIPNDIHEVSV